MENRLVRGLVALTALALAAQAQAQIVTDMTPERVKEAIALGETGKIEMYKIGENKGWGKTAFAFYSTPSLRVALLARDAHARYAKLDPASIPPEAVAPEIEVYAPGEAIDVLSPISVTAVVLMPPGAKARESAIQPTRSAPREERYKNRLGATAMAIALTAFFPIAAWEAGSEVRVVYSTGREAKSKVKLDKVR